MQNMNYDSDKFRPPSYEPYRPQQPRSLFPYCSDDESYLNRQNSSLHSPQWVILLLFKAAFVKHGLLEICLYPFFSLSPNSLHQYSIDH